MINILPSLRSTFTEGESLIILLVLLVILFIMRGLLKYYLSSKIMCVLFSIGTIVLAIFSNETNIGTLGPIIFYTTISTYMYSFGPEVFSESVEYQLEYHEGFFSSFYTIEPRRSGGIFVYLFLGLGLTFLVVNIIGYPSGTPYYYFIIPGICLITSTVSLIRYFR